MRKALRLLPLLLLFLAVAMISRSRSPGVRLSRMATDYFHALRDGRSAEAWEMYSDSLAMLVSPAFLEGLEGFPEPDRVFMEGADAR